MSDPDTGCLYVVATPIGNLDDITYRAVEVLRSVGIIAAEDTRRTSILAQRYGFSTRRISYNDHNARRRIPELMERLKSGKDAALVSDAGTPGISDPGYLLIKTCIEAGIDVVPVPGPTALIAALVVSGLPTARFVFEGFLPVKKGRKTRLAELAEEKRTIILYESPHRILRTLNDLHDAFGDRNAVVVREATKLYEEVIRKPLTELIAVFGAKKPKGEFVLIVNGAP